MGKEKQEDARSKAKKKKKKKEKRKEEKKNNQELQMLNNCLKLFAVQRKHDFGKKKMLQ